MRQFNSPWRETPKSSQPWRLLRKPFQLLVIEIGAGVGYHAIHYAKAHPEEFIIAIEKTTEKFQKLLRRVNNHSYLSNIYPVHGNAVQWISSYIKPLEVAKYFILYPNPYPKQSQKNKRFMHMSFMRYLIDTIESKGSLTLATNENFYYREAKQVFIDNHLLTIKEDRLICSRDIPRTHFEKKYLARGESCYNLIAFKRS